MIKLKRLTLFTLLTFLFQFSSAQKSLFGTWTVSCPLEKTDAASAKFCGLCPTIQKDKSSMDINDFEMSVYQSEITLNINSVTTPVKYNWDEDLQAIEFQYKDIKYKFKVLSSGEKDRRILKNSDGLIITLLKK